MKRALLVASAAACLVVSDLLGSSHAQLQTNQLQTTQLRTNRLFGIYPAVVTNAQDPNRRGRLELSAVGALRRRNGRIDQASAGRLAGMGGVPGRRP